VHAYNYILNNLLEFGYPPAAATYSLRKDGMNVTSLERTSIIFYNFIQSLIKTRKPEHEAGVTMAKLKVPKCLAIGLREISKSVAGALL
jgi:hypothetical protein